MTEHDPIEIMAGIRDRKELDSPGWVIFGGGLAALFGVMILMAPLAFGLTMVRILGAFAIILGIFVIVIAFRLRGTVRSLASPE